MPQKVIKFKGINRAINEFQASGECEELINLRPDVGGGYQVIKNKRAVGSNIEYDLLLEHSWGSFKNFIMVSDGEVYWSATIDGNAKLITNEFERKNVSISFAGNVILIYCEDNKEQLVYKFEKDNYVEYSLYLKKIKDVRVEYNLGSTIYASYSASIASTNESGYEEALMSAASGFYSAYPHGLCGASVIGCEYELTDGSRLWSTAFIVANITEHEYYRSPSISKENQKIAVFGASDVRLHLTFEDKDAGDIKKVNIYATRPIFPYDIDRTNSEYNLKKLSLDDVNLAGQIMYYQGSVDADKTTASLRLNFGQNQTGESIMDVNAGCIERSGDAISYNNRFHFFKSEVKHIIQSPTTSATENTTDTEFWIAYVMIKDSWVLVNNKYSFSSAIAGDYIYPMAGVKKLRFIKAEENDRGKWSVPYNEMFDVELSDSTAYNYSYAFGVKPSVVQIDDAWYDVVAEQGQIWPYAEENGFTEKILLEKEINEVNVSAQFNPFVFPVNYSYNFSGEIIDIITSYLPISATQIGQFPLTVFTTNGIYALEQGSGSVLYSNIIPIQPHVINGSAVATPYGTFFISSKDVYLLSGRESVNITKVLDGERDLRLRDNTSYQLLCCSEYGPLVDYSNIISSLDFSEYIDNATLAYDQLNNELYIGSTLHGINYSYVYNLTTNTFHKVAKKYISSQPGSRYAIEMAGDSRSIVDMHNEIDGQQAILLQSRPMSLEAAHTHIQRLVLLTDAYLTGDHHLCVSVFGSDDLYDWKCIISAQKHDVTLRHIRTNKSAKSYRDYVVLISGYVSTDTDISDIIADYTVVQRRLG
jgi:hypothetical protein